MGYTHRSNGRQCSFKNKRQAELSFKGLDDCRYSGSYLRTGLCLRTRDSKTENGQLCITYKADIFFKKNNIFTFND